MYVFHVKEYMMCDRKKRCVGCKKVLPIDKFPTYRKKNDPSIIRIEHYCKKCRYARESKVTFKRPDVVNLFVERTMYDLNARDY